MNLPTRKTPNSVEKLQASKRRRIGLRPGPIKSCNALMFAFGAAPCAQDLNLNTDLG
jgi:hypothetical protein